MELLLRGEESSLSSCILRIVSASISLNPTFVIGIFRLGEVVGVVSTAAQYDNDDDDHDDDDDDDDDDDENIGER